MMAPVICLAATVKQQQLILFYFYLFTLSLFFKFFSVFLFYKNTFQNLTKQNFFVGAHVQHLFQMWPPQIISQFFPFPKLFSIPKILLKDLPNQPFITPT